MIGFQCRKCQESGGKGLMLHIPHEGRLFQALHPGASSWRNVCPDAVFTNRKEVRRLRTLRARATHPVRDTRTDDQEVHGAKDG
jgi:hypothetical protein